MLPPDFGQHARTPSGADNAGSQVTVGFRQEILGLCLFLLPLGDGLAPWIQRLAPAAFSLSTRQERSFPSLRFPLLRINLPHPRPSVKRFPALSLERDLPFNGKSRFRISVQKTWRPSRPFQHTKGAFSSQRGGLPLYHLLCAVCNFFRRRDLRRLILYHIVVRDIRHGHPAHIRLYPGLP